MRKGGSVASTAPLAIAGGEPVVPRGSHRLWPEIDESDHRAVAAVLDRGVLCGTTAKEVVGLQKEWARYCGARHCLATASGTAALHCAVAAVGVEAGDEVIVPALTFIASAYAVVHQGAKPVFCDIDPRTYNIATDAIEALVTPRTRAIMPVHVHGLPADMDEVRAIARAHGLAVVEDAAQAHGASYRGQPVGTLGDAAAFSLNATKNLVGGEGGLFVTDDDEGFRIARRLALFGEDADRREGGSPAYLSHGLGWNYRCTEMAAAVARAQLRRLDGVTRRAQENARVLSAGLAPLEGVVAPPEPPDRTCTWHKYRVAIEPRALGYEGPPTELRDRVVRALAAEGVAAGYWHTHPLPANPAFRRRELRPWSPRVESEELEPWDPQRFPAASRALDTSFVLGSERAPICAQSPELMRRYADAFAKVIDNVDVLMAA